MGLLDKVKNLFTEEVEDEPVKREPAKKEIIKKIEPKREIQKEVRKVEIAPARRESKILIEDEPVISESPVIQKEEKTVLPIYFSDEDFEDLEKPKPKEVKPQISDIKDIREVYMGRKEEQKKEEKKVFSPSPIISPVYGVLDKNYKKDDITTKESPNVTYYKSEKVTIDDIRNKAYGTLEDDLESSLFNDPIIIDNKEIEEKNDNELDIFEELETRESRNNKVDLLREDFEVTKEEIEEPEEVDKEDLSKELEKQKQRIEEINEIIKNNISPVKKEETSKKIDNILDELDEIEEDLDKENNDDMNIGEEIEDNNDELGESDLFNLIDSMYDTKDDE